MKVKEREVGFIDSFVRLMGYIECGVFNEEQLSQISKGLNNNVDVKLYANPEFNHDQMREIRLGLELGADVNLYAKPELHYVEMKIIRMGMLLLQDGEYRNTDFGKEEVEEVKYAYHLLDLEKDSEIEM